MDVEVFLRERILTDFNTNFMVEAGAGAGKTTLVIDRILNQITAPSKDGAPLKLEDIAAITFTEKAANELKLRISSGIRKRIENETSKEKIQLLDRAKLSIDDQFVGTIHSFCQELLRSNAFEAGLGLDYKVIDQDEDAQVRELVWQRYILENQAGLSGMMSRMDELGISTEEAKAVFDTISRHEYSIIEFDPKAWEDDPPYLELMEMLNPLTEIFHYGPDGALETKFGEPMDKVLNSPERKAFIPYYRNQTGKGAVALAKALSSKYDTEGTIFSKSYAKKGLCLGVLEGLDFEGMKTLCESYYIYTYDVIMSIVYPAIKEYTRYKREIMAVSFDDLLILTRNLLRDSKEARERTRERYKCLYIDEYQDTDSIQSEIMFYLNGDDSDEGASWSERKLIPGSTFIVGDPKQSIYRFRGADITQYNKVKTIFEAAPGCEVVVLKKNFRTQSGIVHWVENVFKLPEGSKDELVDSGFGASRFLFNDPASWQASFYGMDAQRMDSDSHGEKIIKGVYSFLAGPLERVDEYRRSEAVWVSGLIKKLVVENYLLQTFDVSTGTMETRPIQYGDFLILLYNTKGMMDYISALKDTNIPVSYAGKLKLGNIDEIANFIDMAEYLADPGNESMLCNVLINCYGVKNLEEWKRVENNGDVMTIELTSFLEMKNPEDVPFPLRDAMQSIRELALLKDSLSPIAFMRRLLDEYERLYLGRYNEILVRSVAGTLHFLIEKLSTKNLASFQMAAEELTLLKDIDTDREMMLEDRGTNGDFGYVRIMNLHKAKGLEAPIVILATGGIDYSHSASLAIRNSDKGKIVDIKLSKGNGVLGYSRNWLKVEPDEEKNLKAEALRLHYVATTRPINALIISAWSKNNWRRYKEFPSKEIPVDFPVEYIGAGELYPLKYDKVEERKKRLNHKRASLTKISAKQSYLEIRPSKLKEFRGIERGYEAGRGTMEIPSGENWGTLIHRVFELYFTYGSVSDKSINLDIESKLIDIAIDELREVEDFSGYRRAITNILRSFISNHDIARITSSAKLIPELRFDLVRQTGEEPEYITGIIDLLAYTEEGVYLMDYKTNVPHTDDEEEFIGHMIETYKPQIDLYREFLADNLGKRVLGSYLYLTSLDRVVDVSQ